MHFPHCKVLWRLLRELCLVSWNGLGSAINPDKSHNLVKNIQVAVSEHPSFNTTETLPQIMVLIALPRLSAVTAVI